jgi:predicted outer membrane repeat protein
MKFQSFTNLCLFTMLVVAGSILVASPVTAQLFETTFYVTHAGDSGPGSLREAILTANSSPGADMIQIEVDGELMLTSPLPVFNESVSLTAAGYSFIIDGASQYRIFEVPTGVRLELIQLELVSGTGGDGNGGAVLNAGTLEVQDCTFLANFADLGGAIYNVGTAHLGAGTQILSNDAVQGAGIYNLGVLSMEETTFSGNNSSLEGGAIYTTSPVTVLGGEFSAGFASAGAGIYAAGGSLSIEGSIFRTLETNLTGGAIYTDGSLSIHNSSLLENHSVQGGALFLGANAIAEIIDSSLNHNQAETGGAIFNAGTLTITNSSLSGNHAEGHGGALANTGTLKLSSANLTQNTAIGDGGGLNNSSTGITSLDAVTMQENEARAGGAFANAGELEAHGSSLTGNHADWGGAIQNAGTLILQSGQVIENASDSEGGGLYNTGTLTLNELLVVRNRTGFEGGGMVNEGDVVIFAGRFESNDGGDDFGGAISNRPTGILEIVATDFTDNFVNNGGGAIFSSGTLVIQDASFTENNAKWGGAIHNWQAESAVISRTSFTGNSTGHWGGAILNDGNLELEDCTFTGNHGEEFSGALHNNGELVARRVSFSENIVEHGSGGAVENGGNATFEDSTFNDNHAATNGGAINSGRPGSELTLRKVTFTQNAAEDGGAIYSSGALHITGATFSDNVSNNFGGAIYNGGSVEAVDSQFIQNGEIYGTPREGGALYNAVNASASFSNATFDRNYAWYNGGAIASYGSLVVSGSNFTYNLALDHGGAIYQLGDTGSLQDTNFWGNETWEYAGAIASYGTDMHILRCLIVHSYSWMGGAIISSGTLHIENSTIAHNMAEEGAAAIQNYATTTLAYSTIFGNRVISNEWGGALENYASLTMSNSIIAGTADGSNCTGGVASSGLNLSDDSTCEGFTFADPQLGQLQDNGGPTYTHALLWNSPALDTAAGDCPLTDQRGVARPQGLACDLGAFEAVPFMVDIDIAPKSKDNLINLQSTGSISVAVLSVPGFQAPSVVDRASLRFGATGVENPPMAVGPLGKPSCSAGDINGDGLADLVCKFALVGTNFTCSSRVGILTGTLQNGGMFANEDMIRPYPCP